MPSESFALPYGRGRLFDFSLGTDQLVGSVRPPTGLAEVGELISERLASPTEYPPLKQALVGGDRVAIVLDRETPLADELLLGLWKVLEAEGVSAEDIQVVQPAEVRGGTPIDPRRLLPRDVRSAVQWRVHDPLGQSECSYLATSGGGERIYLDREVVDADLTICVGRIAFDEALGFQGTLSAVYPGLSDSDTLRKTMGAGHSELQPENPRPLRELADEVGWLLGVQFVLQVIPAACGGVADVLAGLAEPVMARGKSRLRELWQYEVDQPAELVIASVDEDAGGHGWRQVAAALDAARRIVARDGRILLLTELSDEPTEGIDLIRDAHTPHEAIKPVRQRADVDRIEALQLAKALDRANVYLLSKLPDDLVEDLFMVPLASEQEALRLVEGAERCAVIGSAQNVFVRHAGADT